MFQRLQRLNRRFAVVAVKALSTMTAFYLFNALGLIPILKPSLEAHVLYWSNYIQLVLLPLIMVGSALLGVSIEERAQEDHAAIMEELQLHKKELQEIREIKQILQKTSAANAVNK